MMLRVIFFTSALYSENCQLSQPFVPSKRRMLKLKGDHWYVLVTLGEGWNKAYRRFSSNTFLDQTHWHRCRGSTGCEKDDTQLLILYVTSSCRMVCDSLLFAYDIRLIFSRWGSNNKEPQARRSIRTVTHLPAPVAHLEERSLRKLEVAGSSAGRDIPKSLKMVLTVPRLALRLTGTGYN